MPRLNYYLILAAVLAYLLTAGVTLRDRLLISTLHRIEHNAYFDPSAKDLFEGAMSGMANILSDEFGDGYSLYIPPSKETIYRDILDDRYEGIGISLRTHKTGEEEKLFIDYPLYESPAYRAGLRSGDQILQINGTPVADKNISEIFQLLRQQESEIRLSVLPFGQTEPKDFFVHREKNYYPGIVGNYFDSGSRIFCLEAHPKIGYIWILSFNRATAKEFSDALNSMMQSGAKAFILDLRDNPGGDVWNCVLTARMLMPPDSVAGNVVAMVQDRDGTRRLRHRHFVLTEGSQRCTLPMVVLINGETASSSEILAAALQDHQRATVVGTRSFGKGVIQGIIELPFQSGILQLTDSVYLRPNGANIHRKKNAADSDDWGVRPDKTVEFSEAEQSAINAYRILRANVIADQRPAVLDQFRQQIAESLDGQFEFTGTAPYYDRQLDEAVKILLAETSEPD